MKEIWKTIPGFRNYKVSNLGRVRSKPRWVRNGEKGLRLVRGRILKPHKLRSGYLLVAPYKNYKRRPRLVHRLVLEAFVGPCPKGHEARHYPNQDRTNNRLSNLSWATPKTNANDRIENGTTYIGEANSQTKLTEKKVKLIVKLRKKGYSQRQIARRLEVSPGTIEAILSGKTWRWLTKI